MWNVSEEAQWRMRMFASTQCERGLSVVSVVAMSRSARRPPTPLNQEGIAET
jgi:hypothetical protein